MKFFLSVVSLFLLCGSLSAETRVWRDQQGNMVEGEFVKIVFDKVMIAPPGGGEKRYILLENLSKPDHAYLRSIYIPELTIRFQKSSRGKWRSENALADDRIEIVTGRLAVQAKEKVESDSLRAEVYMVGKEVASDHYRITKKGRLPLHFTEENDYRVVFELETESRQYIEYNREERGTLYDGYLVVILDRDGEMLQHKSNLSWLEDSEVDKLRSFRVNAFFNEDCRRQSPPRPRFNDDRVGVQD